jgi:hypothetical protein
MALPGQSTALVSAQNQSSARLVVRGEYVDTGATYIEGALQYLIVERRDTGAHVIEREYRDRVWLNEGLAPGRYRLVSYTRSCAGSCPPRDDPAPCTDAQCPRNGGLDSPSDRCASNFDLRRGVTLKAVISIGAGSPCRIRLSPHHVTIRGKTEADRILARDLRRYLRRNSGLAPWYHALWRLEATRGVITVRTTLRGTDFGRAAAREICQLIQGADVADFTPGHAVLGQRARRIRTCASRT